MKNVIYQLENESDFQCVTERLIELKILYSFRKYTDSSFPAVGNKIYYGEIIINEDDAKYAEKQIDKLASIKIKEMTNNKTGFKFNNRLFKRILIIYSVIMSILFFKYWYICQKNSKDKNNNLEWSADNTRLTLIDKKTKLLSHAYTDANFDLNFEESRSYSKDGTNVIEYFDLDEDGYSEKIFLYNLNDELIVSQIDTDNDRMVDEMIIILENKDTLRLNDRNKNGFWEITK